MRVAVIGAGPAGLTAAYQLAKAGVEVEVFEASLAVGGLARSLSLWGQTVDLAPQCFSSRDARVNRLWLEVVERDYAMVDRRTRVYDHGQLLDHAPSLAGRLKNRRMFGRQVIESGIKTYCEKVWGIPCEQLDADRAKEWLDRSIHTESLGPKQFAYPISGTGVIYERMADYVRGLGGQVHLGTTVRRVLCERNRVVGLDLAGLGERRFQQVISTLPLAHLMHAMSDVPSAVTRAADELPFRNTLLVYLRVPAENLFPDQWVDVHAAELLAGRITNFRNWVPALCGQSPETILALEYWCSDNEELWKQSDADLIRRAQAEVISAGLLQGAPVTGGHAMRIAQAFPVYPCGYQRPLQTIADYLNHREGLSTVGHCGTGQGNDQEQNILRGLLAAENVLEHREHNLWGGAPVARQPELATMDGSGLVLPGH